ncbi:MAG: phosphate acyltransferase [Candidatus Electryonea clarkiae]|nr:phosphate acyltransferase [Candidatus Electryonea clarkiae]MDP8287595.1 phosphate acyltransferase [Candidatus Electryonea clarkiae]
MFKKPETIEEILKQVSNPEFSKRKPVVGLVVGGPSRDFDAAISLKKKGWIELKLLGDREQIGKLMLEAWMEPDYYEIEQCVNPNEQIKFLQNWCKNGEVDVLLHGDMTPRQLYHLLSNPYHRLPLENGVTRACVLSLPSYPKLLTIAGHARPGPPSYDSLVIHLKNSVHLCRALGIERPKIAFLSPMDEVGIDDFHTYNCQVITSMVGQEQISGVDVEGPLSFDTAIDPWTAEQRNRIGPVAGQADVIIVDSHQTRSVLALTLSSFGEAYSARILLGGKVPIAILPQAKGDEIDEIAAIGLALSVVPYLKKADPLDWLTHPDPMDYAW